MSKTVKKKQTLKKKLKKAKQTSAVIVADQQHQFLSRSENLTLARRMAAVGLIEYDKIDEQSLIISSWNDELKEAMNARVLGLAKKELKEEGVMPPLRKWGPGSDISKNYRNRLQKNMPTIRLPASVRYDRFDGYALPASTRYDRYAQLDGYLHNHINDDNEPFWLAPENTCWNSNLPQSDSNVSLTKDGANESAFISDLRNARELLDSYDQTYTEAKISLLASKAEMQREEAKYDGTNDESKLRKSIIKYAKFNREFIIIEKIYNQAVRKFVDMDIAQAPDEEIVAAINKMQRLTDYDDLFGGKYKTGDNKRKPIKVEINSGMQQQIDNFKKDKLAFTKEYYGKKT